jgi:hypothetical protein
VQSTTDSTTFVGLYEDATGTIGGKTNTGITYNATTETLKVTGIETNNVTAPETLTGTYRIFSPTTITLDATDEVLSEAPVRFVSKTTSQLSTLVASVGSVVYNTTDSKLYVYNGTSWSPATSASEPESYVDNFQVTSSGTSAYIIDGASNPTLTLVRGQSYFFTVNASGHPFWIKTAQTTGTGNQYNSGVTNNGDDVGGISFTVPNDAPSTLYYICQFHGSMTGTISIIG